MNITIASIARILLGSAVPEIQVIILIKQLKAYALNQNKIKKEHNLKLVGLLHSYAIRDSTYKRRRSTENIPSRPYLPYGMPLE
jgi:hypothetical protein